MIKIPLSDIIAKIKEKAQLTEEEINSRIDDKLKQLSGLISKEGAAHIIANELGIKLFEQFTGRLQIKNILAGMRDVETVGKVTQIFAAREFQSGERKGKVGNIVVGDETGSIRVVCWGSVSDDIPILKEGDIVKIISGYVRENNGRKEVHLNDRSKLIINPEGETIGEIKRTVALRKQIKNLQEDDENIELLGTIVQVFEPRFFEVCPSCGKRARQRELSYVCEEHGEIKPDYSYVFNIFLDDGTETVRSVFFKNQAEHLLNMNQEQIMQFRENPEKFEEMKTQLLGNIIKIVGRAKKNEMFDRLEFMAQLVFSNPGPEEEIRRLEEAGEKEVKAEEVKSLPSIDEI